MKFLLNQYIILKLGCSIFTLFYCIQQASGFGKKVEIPPSSE